MRGRRVSSPHRTDLKHVDSSAASNVSMINAW